MSAVFLLLKGLFEVFKFTMNVTIDVACMALGLAALAAPWRIPFVLAGLSKGLGSGARDEYRGHCVSQFGYSAVDLVLLPWLPVALAMPTRTLPCLVAIFKAINKGGSREHNWGPRWVVFAGGFLSIFDALTAVPLAFLIASLFGMPRFLKRSCSEERRSGDEELMYDAPLRFLIWEAAGRAVVDVLALPFGLVCLLSWRTAGFQRAFKQRSGGFEQRLVCIQYFFKVLMDLPFAPFGAVVLLTGWRARTWLRKVGEGGSVRGETLVQFWLLLVDAGALALALLMLPTHHSCLLWSKLRLASTGMRTAAPLRRVESVALRLGGGRVRLELTGRTGAPDVSTKRARLFVCGDYFWALAGSALGNSMTTVVRSLLPMSLDGDGELSVEDGKVTVSVAAKVKPSTIRKKLERIGGNAPLRLQIETEAGVLVGFTLTVQQLLDSLDADAEAPGQPVDAERADQIEPQESKPVVDVWAVTVAAEFGDFLIDAACLVAVFALFLLPHRGVACWVLLMEPVERWDKRVAMKLIQMLEISEDERDQFEAGFLVDVEALMTQRAGLDLRTAVSVGSKSGRKTADPRLVKHVRLGAMLFSAAQEADAAVARSWASLWDNLAERLRAQLGMVEAVKRLHADDAGQDTAKVLASLTERVSALEQQRARVRCEDMPAHAERLAAEVGGFKLWPAALCKRPQAQARAIIKSQVLGAAADVAALLSLALVLASVYRVPGLLRGLKHATFFEWRRMVCYEHAYLLVRDVVALVQLVVVVVALYDTADMLLDLTDCVASPQRSWARVHEIAQHYYWLTLDHLSELLNVFKLWEAYLWTAATVLWGLFVPVEMVAQMLAHVARVSNSCVRNVLACLLAGALNALPFVVVLVLVPRETTTGELDDAGRAAVSDYLGVFLGAVLAVGCVGVLTASRLASSGADGGRPHRVRDSAPLPSKSIGFTGANAAALGRIALDTAQLIAMSFAALSVSTSASAPEHNSPAVDWLLDNGSGLLLTAKASVDSVATAERVFWTFMGFVGLWFFVSAMPVVVEEVLEWRERGTFARNAMWRILRSALSATLFLAICQNLLRPLQCDADSRLVADPSIACWDEAGPQPTMALVGMLGLTYFVLSSQILAAALGSSSSSSDDQAAAIKSEKLDVEYPLTYRSLLSLTKLVLSVLAVVFQDDRVETFLWFVFAACAGMVVVTLLFKPLTGQHACASLSAVGLRAASFAAAAVGAAAALTLHAGGDDQEQHAETVLVYGEGAVAALLALFLLWRWWSGREARAKLRQAVQRARDALVQLEDELASNACLLPGWPGKAWRADVKKARGPAGCRRLALQLESFVPARVLSAAWLRGGGVEWRAAAWASPDALVEAVQALHSAVSREFLRPVRAGTAGAGPEGGSADGYDGSGADPRDFVESRVLDVLFQSTDYLQTALSEYVEPHVSDAEAVRAGAQPGDVPSLVAFTCQACSTALVATVALSRCVCPCGQQIDIVPVAKVEGPGMEVSAMV